MTSPTLSGGDAGPTVIKRCLGDDVPKWLYISSDHHIGGRHTDYDLIQREVARAKELNALCILNGDLFDLILPRDQKRFEPTALHDRLVGKNDIIGEALDWAVEIFSPIAAQIAVVGFGNHEHAVLKHHAIDVISAFVMRLRAKGSEAVPGGPEGYLLLETNSRGMKGREKKKIFRLFYTHGAGGASPMTLGVLDLQKIRPWAVDADAICIGHKHNRLFVPTVRQKVTPEGRIYHLPTYLIMSGSYIKRGSSAAPSYASRAVMAPQPMGGLFAKLAFKRIRENGSDLTTLQFETIQIGT